MTEFTDKAVQTAIELGAEIGELRKGPDGTPFVVHPENWTVEDLPHMRDAPARIKEAISLHEEASLVDYINAFKGDGTRAFADVTKTTITAVIDYHWDKPEFGHHTASYACPRAEEWKTWTGMNGKTQAQKAFARFVEDNLPDIVAPPGAEMLEIARSLGASKTVEFKSEVREKDGSHTLLYDETIRDVKTPNKLTVPDVFVIGIPVFQGGERYSLQARLRFRIEEGKLFFHYDLVRPEAVLDDAFRTIVGRVATATDVPIHYGASPR